MAGLNQEEALLLETEGLIQYSQGSRISALLFKLFWGLCSGATNFLTFSAFIASTMFWTIIGIIPGILYGIQAVKFAHNNNLKEQALIKNYLEVIADQEKIFFAKKTQDQQAEDNIFLHTLMNYLGEMLVHFQGEQTTSQEENEAIEHLYFHVQELMTLLKYLTIVLNAKKIISHADEKNRLDQNIAILETYSKQLEIYQQTFNNLRGDKKDQPATPHGVQLSNKSEDKIVEKQLWVYTQKASNRALAFLAGASIGASIAAAIITALGITITLSFLLSNPIGWSILGSTLLFGVAGVALDYLITRRQDEKIRKLEQVVALGNKNKTNADIQINHVEELHRNVLNKKSQCELQKEVTQLQLQMESLTKQNVTLRQHPDCGHACVDELSASDAVASEAQPDNLLSQIEGLKNKITILENENKLLLTMKKEQNNNDKDVLALQQEHALAMAKEKEKHGRELKEIAEKHQRELEAMKAAMTQKNATPAPAKSTSIKVFSLFNLNLKRRSKVLSNNEAALKM